MTTYAFIMTAVTFFVMGLTAHSAFEEWIETRARKRRKAKRRAKIEAAFGADALSTHFDEAVTVGNDQAQGSPILS